MAKVAFDCPKLIERKTFHADRLGGERINERDELEKEINQAMAVRLKATKDLQRVTEEKNATEQEYSLVR